MGFFNHKGVQSHITGFYRYAEADGFKKAHQAAGAEEIRGNEVFQFTITDC